MKADPSHSPGHQPATTSVTSCHLINFNPLTRLSGFRPFEHVHARASGGPRGRTHRGHPCRGLGQPHAARRAAFGSRRSCSTRDIQQQAGCTGKIIEQLERTGRRRRDSGAQRRRQAIPRLPRISLGGSDGRAELRPELPSVEGHAQQPPGGSFRAVRRPPESTVWRLRRGTAPGARGRRRVRCPIALCDVGDELEQR